MLCHHDTSLVHMIMYSSQVSSGGRLHLGGRCGLEHHRGSWRRWRETARSAHTQPGPSLVYQLEEDRSHERKDPVHEHSHDSSTEEPCYRHGHEPGHKDVPEEAPVHGLPRANPAHGHHRTDLEGHRRFRVKPEARHSLHTQPMLTG